MIPFRAHTRDSAEPNDPIHYRVAANGIFLVDRSRLFTSVTPVGFVPGLAPAAASLRLSVPRIPRPVMERTFGFFRAVHETFAGAEAIVFIFYAPDTRAFRLAVPPQTLFRHQQASGHGWMEPRVTYRSLPSANGFVKLGDIHSHGAHSAQFSATDDRDDATEVGLRIVLGRVHNGCPDVSVSFVAHGTRFLLRREDILEDFSVPLTPPRRWLQRVTCQARRHEDWRDDGLLSLP